MTDNWVGCVGGDLIPWLRLLISTDSEWRHQCKMALLIQDILASFLSAGKCSCMLICGGLCTPDC